jgi:hypothetical protein
LDLLESLKLKEKTEKNHEGVADPGEDPPPGSFGPIENLSMEKVAF